MALEVPFLKQLEGGFNPGQTLVINGSANYTDGFVISLMAGKQLGSDTVALQLNFQDKQVSLNSFNNGKWTTAVVVKTNLTLAEGVKIDLRLRAHEDRIEVYLNRKLLTNFDHREALQSVNHLYVEGSFDLEDVTFGGKYYPIPYVANLGGKLDVGHKLLMTGIPAVDKQNNFDVKLVAGNGDILFAFIPRFNENGVVRNANLNNIWGTEEREGGMPFHKDELFDLIISNEPYGYEVSVNGKRFCGFAHRAAPTDIQTVQIQGGVRVQALSAK